MIRFWYIGVCVLFLACTKDKGIIKKEVPVINELKPQINFVFVNRLGFRKDSAGNGVVDTVLKGVCIEVNYFMKTKNITNQYYSCYERDSYDPTQLLSDSILVKSFSYL